MTDLVKAALLRHAIFGEEAGHFVEAVLRNDLRMALWRADPTNLAHLKEIVMYVHWNLPSACHGSPEKVLAWRKKVQEEGPILPAEEEARVDAERLLADRMGRAEIGPLNHLTRLKSQSRLIIQ